MALRLSSSSHSGSSGRTQESRQRGMEMPVRAALMTGVAGFVVGFSLGYMNGMHAQCIGTTGCPSMPSCLQPSQMEQTNILLSDAERRIAALESARSGSTLANAAPPKVPEEVIGYCEECEVQLKTLREQAAKEGDSGGSFEAELGQTAWKRVVGYNREELWKRTLAGYPYAGGASSSRDALLFLKKDANDLESCAELNVVVASNKPGVCLAVFDSRLPVYTMLRIDNSGGRLIEEERKKGMPKKYVSPPADWYLASRLKHRALVMPQADTVPNDRNLRESLAATGTFALEAPRLRNEVKAIIKKRKIAYRNNTVVVMATNFGTIDIVVNFVCSCRSAGLANALRSVLVFAADSHARAAVENLDVAAFHDPGLGKLPEEAATAYGDYAFVRMMWLKVTAVFLVITTGHSVLFQDADVVWLSDPLAFFAYQADPAVDTYWMDDGARSLRYTPFYSNSGFYFLRKNERTTYFMYRLLLAYDTILAVRSHQHALIMVMLDAVAKYGLSVNVLDNARFPQGETDWLAEPCRHCVIIPYCCPEKKGRIVYCSRECPPLPQKKKTTQCAGQVFHHNKALMQSIVDGSQPAFVFHMCWTAGRTDKLKYMKNMGLWFLQPTCDLTAFRHQRDFRNISLNRRACCHNLPAFHVPNPYSATISINSIQHR